MPGWIDLYSNSAQPFSCTAAPRPPAVSEPAAFGTCVTLEDVGSPLITLVPEVPFSPGSPYNTMQKCLVTSPPVTKFFYLDFLLRLRGLILK